MATRDLKLRMLFEGVNRATGPIAAIRGGAAALAGTARGGRTELANLGQAARQLQGPATAAARGFAALEQQTRQLGQSVDATARAPGRLASMLQTLRGGMARTGDEAGSLQERMTATRRSLDQLRETGDRMRTLPKLAQEAAATGEKLQAARQRVNQLAREMAAAESPSARLTASFERAKASAASLKQRHADQTQALHQLKNQLRATGINADDLSGSERRLQAQILATSRAMEQQEAQAAELARQRQRLSTARDNYAAAQDRGGQLMAGGATAMAAGAAGGAAMIMAAGEARTFEAGMTSIAQKVGMGREEAAGLGREIILVSRQVNQLPMDLQRGVDTLAGLGMAPREALISMQAAGQAATAYEARIEDLAAASFASIDNLKVPFEQTGRVLDIMAEAGKRGAFEIKDMAGAFPALTASAAALGQTGPAAVADLAAALQITRKGAGDSSTAANNLQNLLNKINSEETLKNFADAGINLPRAMADAARRGLSPIEAIVEQTIKATGGQLSQLPLFFGDAQVQGALRPLIQNLELYRSIRADALKADGVVANDFAERMRDGAEAADMMAGSTQALVIQFGQALSPTLAGVQRAITKVFDAATQWMAANPGLARGAAMVAAGVAGLLVVGGALVLTAGALLAPFAALQLAWLMAPGGLALVAGGFKAVGGAMMLAGRAMLLNPLGLILTGLAVAAVLIITNWSRIGPFFAGLWSSISGAFSNAWSSIQAGAASAFDWLKNLFLTYHPVGILIRHWDRIPAAFRALWGRVTGVTRGWVDAAAGMGRNIIAGLAAGIRAAPGAVWNALQDVVMGGVRRVKGMLGIKSPSRVFMGIGGDITAGMRIGVQRGTDGPLTAISRLADGSLAIARQISQGAALQAARGLAVASGVAAGLVNPAPALAGAPGLAAAPPAMVARAAPARPSMQVHLNFTIQGAGADPQGLAREIASQVRLELDRLARDHAAEGLSSFDDGMDG